MLYTEGMRKSKSGFTLVELLIVVVIIVILAAITIVVYRGAQGRARDAQRVTDITNIMKALSTYYGDNSVYPPTSATPIGSCTGLGTGYSYSFATDLTWLKPLVDGNYIDRAPTAPNSSCTSWYRYLNPPANSYNCPTRTKPYYVITVSGGEGNPPANSRTFTPCAGSTVTWTASSSIWVFNSDDLT